MTEAVRSCMCSESGEGVKGKLDALALEPTSLDPRGQRPYSCWIEINSIYLGIAKVAEVAATSFLTSSNGMIKLWPTLASMAGYAMACYFLTITLKKIPTGIAYGIWSGVGFLLFPAVGWLWFKQTLDAPALAGIGMIMAGGRLVRGRPGHRLVRRPGDNLRRGPGRRQARERQATAPLPVGQLW